ncbi:alpha/beta fold hydrolase [Candidatus Paracaedibacter symbiosus]|uniref:alpha/beta fold hydrolase n=1 Tax=Candidatus Paracaedibacter symbiosus TaxID=244582 RepID=UPI000689D879|nr:alpha/beta hydrolase [Candidatus Paracaedibacter symbiosus]
MFQLIWSHGWGFDTTFFKPLLQALPDYDHLLIDWGYFGDPSFRTAASYPCVGIGHSLGFAKLLELPRLWAPPSFSGLISLGGFTKFCQHADFKVGIPRRVVQRMVDKFATQPRQVLSDFYQSCGYDQDWAQPSFLSLQRLTADLQFLKTVSTRLPKVPHLAIAGETDQICSLAQQQTLFDRVEIVKGAHNFPATHIDETATLIRHFLKELA